MGVSSTETYGSPRLEVIAVTPRGYCHGVVTAMNMAKQLAERDSGPKYMLGYLVHNEHMTAELEEMGVELIDSDDRLAGLELIDEGTVILTAHGVSPTVREKLSARGLKSVDTTCSDVQVTHDLVIDLADRGFEVIYIGKRGHPETVGVLGEVPGKVHFVENSHDVEQLDLESDRIAVTTQTTISVWDTAETIRSIKRKYPDAEIHNDICRATQDRQEAVVEAAADVELVVVVGSERSSNSKRLVEVVTERVGKPAYLVDSVADLRPEWFDGIKRVAVTSGASTPSRLTREVIKTLKHYPNPV